eukprot:2388008-Lingulodinium_polyedra.AAC.1
MWGIHEPGVEHEPLRAVLLPDAEDDTLPRIRGTYVSSPSLRGRSKKSKRAAVLCLSTGSQ